VSSWGKRENNNLRNFLEQQESLTHCQRSQLCGIDLWRVYEDRLKKSGRDSPGDKEHNHDERLVLAALDEAERGHGEDDGLQGEGLLPANAVYEDEGEKGAGKFGKRRPDQFDVVVRTEAAEGKVSVSKSGRFARNQIASYLHLCREHSSSYWLALELTLSSVLDEHTLWLELSISVEMSTTP
jgi:hypothetical protein